MKAWGITDPGLRRQENQDTLRIVSLSRESLIAVICDGMGGARSGNIASGIAAEVFVDRVQRGARAGMDGTAMRQLLSDAVAAANRAVFEQARGNAMFSGMGTTLVAALVIGGQAAIAHVGDSRAYYCDPDKILCLTRDHSVVEMMVQHGELTREQAKQFPGKNLITRAVGTEGRVECDLTLVTLEENAKLLLCSDGLSNELADQEILFEVVHGGSDADCCGRLLNIAKRRGAPDNVSVVLISR